MAEPSRRTATKRMSLLSTRGRRRVLDFQEQVSVWTKWCSGANIFDLSVEFKCEPPEIERAINSVAAQRGFPNDHLDPELERFRILELSDWIKNGLTQTLAESHQIIIDLNSARNSILQRPIDDQSEPKKRTINQLGESEKKEYFSLVESRQGELKTLTNILAELRNTNSLISDLAGVKKARPKREPKPVATPEDILASAGIDVTEIEILAKSDEIQSAPE